MKAEKSTATEGRERVGRSPRRDRRGGSGLVDIRFVSARTRPERLLAEAYTQKRPFDLRIAVRLTARCGARRAGIESSFEQQIPLLDAKARIAKGLASSPDSADWLYFEGRAEMLSRTTDAAISSLARALNVRPDDSAIMADLGAAYALRAQADNRVVDYSAAIEYPDAGASYQACFSRGGVQPRCLV